jgi:signal transduction histidine kinase/DNA-binding response OmpR family regulator
MLPPVTLAKAKSAAVLLVDDNPANLLALEAVLSPIGVRTVSALTPRAALAHLGQESFAAALIDVQMPEMDGFELAKRIRQMDRGQQLPILFITAIYQDEQYVSRGYESGAADYITKPFDPNVVRNRVKAFVDLYEQRESVGQKQIAVRTRERDEAIRRLVAFERIATAALETNDIRSLLGELLNAFTDAADAADSSAILLRDGDWLQVEASVGLEDEARLGSRVRIGEGFAGRVAAERRPVEHAYTGAGPADSQPSKPHVTRGLYGVPLLHGGDVLGVAQIGSTRASSFSDAEKRLFNAAVDRAALAVTRHLELSSLYEILSVAPALIAIVRTPEYRYSFANPAFQALFQAKLDGLSLADHNFSPDMGLAVERSSQLGETVSIAELPVVSPAALSRPDGPRYVSFTAHPLRNTVGAVDRVLMFAVNVTSQVLARQEIEATQAARAELLEQERAARQAAEAASIAKDEFLATVSHELRTPLNAILGWATMARTKVAPDVDRALGIIEKSAQAQARIVEDVLDFSRIARGQMRLTLAKVDVATIVRDALEAVRPAAAAKGIVFDVNLDLAQPVNCDGPRLQQVAWNLLTNAIKFSEPNGVVEVRAGLSRRSLTLSVRDCGHGIEPQFVPHVFEAFTQAEGGSTRRHGGLGLGLAIVKEIVQAHGGTIEASSEGPGRGAKFSLEIPLDGAKLEVSPPRPASVPPPSANYARLDGIRILVVEDDDDSREFLTEALEQRGATVSAASGVAAALARFEAFRAHILVSDIAMPDADGYDLIQRVRGMPAERGGKLPAIAVTAHTRAEVRERVLAAGYQQLEPKPVDLERLSRAIVALTGAAPGAHAAEAGAGATKPDARAAAGAR